jgi:hypothetical protein
MLQRWKHRVGLAISICGPWTDESIGASRWSPIYSLFSDFGSKIPEESAMPDRTFGGIVRAYALSLPELLVSLTT